MKVVFVNPMRFDGKDYGMTNQMTDENPNGEAPAPKPLEKLKKAELLELVQTLQREVFDLESVTADLRNQKERLKVEKRQVEADCCKTVSGMKRKIHALENDLQRAMGYIDRMRETEQPEPPKQADIPAYSGQQYYGDAVRSPRIAGPQIGHGNMSLESFMERDTVGRAKNTPLDWFDL